MQLTFNKWKFQKIDKSRYEVDTSNAYLQVSFFMIANKFFFIACKLSVLVKEISARKLCALKMRQSIQEWTN